MTKRSPMRFSPRHDFFSPDARALNSGAEGDRDEAAGSIFYTENPPLKGPKNGGEQMRLHLREEASALLKQDLLLHFGALVCWQGIILHQRPRRYSPAFQRASGKPPAAGVIHFLVAPRQRNVGTDGEAIVSSTLCLDVSFF